MNTIRIDRAAIEDDILQQVGHEVQEALLMYAPEQWTDEDLDAIEEKVTKHTRLVMAALTTDEIQSAGALRRHIANAIADAKKLIHERV